jgi:molybdopterin molybdotransferase
VAPLLSIDEARAAVLDAVTPLAAEEVAVDDALGRVLAEDVVAANDVPPFDNSAMDGFVVVAGPAGRELTIVGESRAGAPADRAPGEGEAIRVSTGAAVPSGAGAGGAATAGEGGAAGGAATAGEGGAAVPSGAAAGAALGVVPVEQTTETDGRVRVEADVAPGQHLRRAGEDIARGRTVLRSGTLLGPAELGVAVVAGRASLRCAAAPRVALLITGDELRDAGAPLSPGEIHESNGTTLGALARRAGASVVHRQQVEDDHEATERAIADALARADVLILSGGVSVGPHDHVKRALEANGVEERFWRVALRPGKPTWFGTTTDTLVFGLPGNPVSAMVTFLLFVRPALAKLQGADPRARRIRAPLLEAVERNPGRDEAVRVTLTVEGATPTGPQGSHQLTSMLNADGLAIVTAGDGTAQRGEHVEVDLL